MREKWIKGAIKKPGALRESMGKGPGEKISDSELAAKERSLRAAGAGNKKLSEKQRTELRRVVLARTLKSFG